MAVACPNTLRIFFRSTSAITRCCWRYRFRCFASVWVSGCSFARNRPAFLRDMLSDNTIHASRHSAWDGTFPLKSAASSAASPPS